MTEYESEAYEAARELLEAAGVGEGGILVAGCSTSEVLGGAIGKNSSPEAGAELFSGIAKAAAEKRVWVAAQCCEHLGRAIIIEREAVRLPLSLGLLTEVNVVPQPKAGGSFATAAYRAFREPTALEHIRADCGLDIGGTLIGMHLREVAVPVRLTRRMIGGAVLIAARTRPKFAGGARAVYNEALL